MPQARRAFALGQGGSRCAWARRNVPDQVSRGSEPSGPARRVRSHRLHAQGGGPRSVSGPGYRQVSRVRTQGQGRRAVANSGQGYGPRAHLQGCALHRGAAPRCGGFARL